MWLSLIWFILVLFVCWNLFCTITNLRINCVTETKNASVLFYKNLKSSFLHSSHIWLWGFFTFLVALAHGAARLPRMKRKAELSRSLMAIRYFKVKKVWFYVNLNFLFLVPVDSKFKLKQPSKAAWSSGAVAANEEEGWTELVFDGNKVFQTYKAMIWISISTLSCLSSTTWIFSFF